MIAILGGTFDPVHRGHIHIATRILQQEPIEQVQFMPCAEPVHRRSPQASPEQRCQMIEIEISKHSGLALNRVEVDRGGPSYSIDSLREMHRQGFGRLALILGSDSFAGFADWKEPDEILRLAHLIVCRRPGNYPESGVYAAQKAESADELQSRSAGAILILDVEAPDCASSRLRDRIAAGEDARDCLGPAVADYIEHNGLYRGVRDGER